MTKPEEAKLCGTSHEIFFVVALVIGWFLGGFMAANCANHAGRLDPWGAATENSKAGGRVERSLRASNSYTGRSGTA